MPKERQKRDAALSRQRIISHAIELFSQKGYDAASMDTLAEHCGLNKAMVFYYFKSKKGLYEAVMRDVLVKIQETIIEENQTHDTPKEELKGFILTYAKFAFTHPYLPSLLLKELSDSGAVIPEMLFASMRQLYALFCDILKRGEKEGCFREVKPMPLYFMVLGTLNLMVTTKALRIKASQLDDIEVDTCAECSSDDIAATVLENIVRIVHKEISQ